jgi:hypothetical protein
MDKELTELTKRQANNPKWDPLGSCAKSAVTKLQAWKHLEM